MVEESQTLGDEVEFTEGLTIDRGFLSPYFISDQERSLCEYKNPKVGAVAAGGWGLEAPWDATVRGHVVVFQTRCSSWRTKITCKFPRCLFTLPAWTPTPCVSPPFLFCFCF